MFLSDCNCYDSLSHVDPTAFLAVFESTSPSCEVATLGGDFLCGGAKWRFVDLRITAVDFEFFYAGGLLKLAEIKCFHFNDYNNAVAGPILDYHSQLSSSRRPPTPHSPSPLNPSSRSWTLNQLLLSTTLPK